MKYVPLFAEPFKKIKGPVISIHLFLHDYVVGHEVAGREFRLWPLLKSMPVNYCTLTLSGCLVSNTLYFCMLACISFVTQNVFGSITIAS